MKHLFIINPAAGGHDRTREYTEDIQRVCGAAGLDYSIRVSGGQGECTRIAAEAARAGEPLRVYACGGDGTLNEIVTGIAGFPNAAVTVLAGGSGNDFIRMFSQPEAFRDLERLLDPEEAEFDLIRCGDWLSLNICSVGLDARIAADVNKYKRIPLLQGFRAYAVSAAANLLKRIAEPYEIDICGQTLQGEYTLVCVCSGRYYGGGFNPVPEADPCDGLLEVLAIRRVTPLQAAGVIGRYKAGRYKELPELVSHFRTDRLQIRCPWDTALNLDGEIRTIRSADIRLAEEKIRFFYPRGLTF